MPIGYTRAPRVTGSNQESRTRRLSRSLTTGNNGTPMVFTLFSTEEQKIDASPVAANTAAQRAATRWFSTEFAANSAVDIGYWQNAGYISLRLMNTGAAYFSISYASLGTAGANAVLFMNSSSYMTGDATKFSFDAGNSAFAITCNSTAATRGFQLGQHNDGAQGAIFRTYKSRGTSAAPTVVANGDYCCFFGNYWYDGATYRASGGFGFTIDGTPSSGVTPSRVDFVTTNTSAGAPTGFGTSRLTIRASGNVGINETDPIGSLHATSQSAGTILILEAHPSQTGDYWRAVNSSNTVVANLSVNSLLTIVANAATTTPQLLLEQVGAGDAGITFKLTGVAGYSMGIDNSDSDKFKICIGNTIGTLTDEIIVYDPPNDQLSFRKRMLQYVNDVSTVAGYIIEQNGAGDAALGFRITATTNFTIGIDNDDQDHLKIAKSNTLGTSDYILFRSDGVTREVDIRKRVVIYHNDTSTASQLQLQQNATGDAVMEWLLSGGQSVTAGIDNSDSDKWKLSMSDTLGTTDAIRVNTYPSVNFPTHASAQKFSVGGSGVAARDTFYVYAVAHTMNTGESARTLVLGMPQKVVSANGTYYLWGGQLSVLGNSHSIANGVTDLGWRIGFTAECYSEGAEMAGTLQTQIGFQCRHGQGNVAATGTIVNSIGLNIQSYLLGGSITNLWGVYQQNGDATANAKNYFQGWTRISPAYAGAPVHLLDLDVNDTVTNGQVRIYQGGTGDASIHFTIGGSSPWSIGIDNSDSDKFKIGAATDLGTSTMMAMNSTGIAINSDTVVSTLGVGGSFGTAITTVSANTTLNTTHYTVLVNAATAGVTITLPAASGVTGRMYVIKKIDSSANTVTIDGNGTEKIDGANTVTLSAQWNSRTIQCDGSAWYIIATV